MNKYYFILVFVIASSTQGMITRQEATAQKKEKVLTDKSSVNVKAMGNLLAPDIEQSLATRLIQNPSKFLTEISYLLEDELRKKIQEITNMSNTMAYEQLLGALRNAGRPIHNEYIFAQSLETFLKQNPYWIAYFNDQKTIEENNISSQMLANTFNKIQKLTYSHLSYNQYMSLKEQYQKDPRFILIHAFGECIECNISRLKFPFIREHLENKIIEAIKQMHPNTNDQISLADIGAGNLFQTMIILTKLAAAGYKNIRLTIVDPLYQDILSYYKTKQENPVIIALDMPLIDKALVSRKNVTNGKIAFDTIILPTIEKNIHNNILASLYMWCNGLGITLDMLVYGNFDDYRADCTNNPDLRNDIVMAVDFENPETTFELLTINMLFFNALLKPTGKAYAITKDRQPLSQKEINENIDKLLNKGLSNQTAHAQAQKNKTIIIFWEKQRGSSPALKWQWDLNGKKLISV